ncbi:EpsG family protein [Vibrio splendidus]
MFLFSLLISINYEKFDAKLRFLVNITSVLFITLFFGLKYNTGTDSVNYQRLYDLAIYIYDAYGEYYLRVPEVLYFGLNLFSALNDYSTVLIYMVCGFLIAISTMYSAIYLKVNPFLLFVIIFPFHIVMMAISGIRQGVSESFVLLASAFILNGNKKLAFLMIAIATGFHASSLIFLSILFIDVKKRFLLILVPCFFGASLISGNSEYGHYVGSELFNAGIFMRVGFVLVLTLAIFLTIKCMTERTLLNPYSRWIYFSYCCFPALVLLGIINTTLADRVSYYFICILSLVYLFFKRKFGAPLFITPIMVLASFVCLLAFLTFGNHADTYYYDSYIYHLFDN